MVVVEKKRRKKSKEKGERRRRRERRRRERRRRNSPYDVTFVVFSSGTSKGKRGTCLSCFVSAFYIYFAEEEEE